MSEVGCAPPRGSSMSRCTQVRGTGEPFRSSLMGFLDGNSEVLESLVNEMYARGLSTRDVEDRFATRPGSC
jgi:putative transposase